MTIKDTYEFLGEQDVRRSRFTASPTMGNVSGHCLQQGVSFEKAGITGTADRIRKPSWRTLKQIQDKTDAIPLYTNYAAGWTLTAWDSTLAEQQPAMPII